MILGMKQLVVLILFGFIGAIFYILVKQLVKLLIKWIKNVL